MRALRVDAGARHEQGGRSRDADPPDHVRRDDRGHDAEPRLGEREGGIGRGDRDVGDRDEAGSAANRGALHARDERHFELIERAEHRAERAGVRHVLGQREIGDPAQPTDVRPRAEGVAFAREDHCPRRGVDPLHERGQLRDECPVERVLALRARQGEARDMCWSRIEADTAHNANSRRASNSEEGCL